MGTLLDDPCVIHKPKPNLGELEAGWRVSLSKCSMYTLATMGLTSNPSLLPQPAHRIHFEMKSMYYAEITSEDV